VVVRVPLSSVGVLLSPGSVTGSFPDESAASFCSVPDCCSGGGVAGVVGAVCTVVGGPIGPRFAPAG